VHGYESVDLYALGLSDHGSPTGGARLATSARWIQGIAWTADSREVVFAGDLAGRSGLWRVQAFASGRARRLNGIGHDSGRLKRMGRYRGMSVSVSRTGGRLAYTQGVFDANIWRVSLGRDKGPAARLIWSTKDDIQPAYSPNGRQIAFESDRAGNEEIWVCQADGASPFQVTNFGAGWSGSPRWSPDGSTIAFDRLERNTWNVYLVAGQGGKPALLAVDASGPTWSRDGVSLYFTSERTGRAEVWKSPATGGPAVQVTVNGGMAPSESPDGQFLYFSRATGPNNVALWKTGVAGGVETKVLDQLLFPGAYALAANGIYVLQGTGTSMAPFGAARGSPPPIRYLDIKTEKQTTVGSTDGTNLAGRIAVSPDERWLLYGHEDGTGTDIMLVENFR
jgi:Tol biopolymer transport system component